MAMTYLQVSAPVWKPLDSCCTRAAIVQTPAEATHRVELDGREVLLRLEGIDSSMSHRIGDAIGDAPIDWIELRDIALRMGVAIGIAVTTMCALHVVSATFGR